MKQYGNTWGYAGWMLVLALAMCAGCADDRTAQQARTEDSEFDIAYQKCEQACLDARSHGQDLSHGPCLINGIDGAPSYVCDVAHSPREDVDNDKSNQCPGYDEYFLEFDPGCAFIKARTPDGDVSDYAEH